MLPRSLAHDRKEKERLRKHLMTTITTAATGQRQRGYVQPFIYSMGICKLLLLLVILFAASRLVPPLLSYATNNTSTTQQHSAQQKQLEFKLT